MQPESHSEGGARAHLIELYLSVKAIKTVHAQSQRNLYFTKRAVVMVVVAAAAAAAAAAATAR